VFNDKNEAEDYFHVMVSGVLGLVGNTPIVELERRGEVRVYVKLEYMNPTGSHKDRIAVYMVRDAVERGLLREGGTVVEASSGNTAISVAWVCSLLGYRAVIFVEENTSPAKVKTIRLLGAEVVKVPERPLGHPENILNVARRYAEENGYVYLNQFANEANVRAHYETTGPEIYSQLKGKVDVFVMGIGTGGTIAGVGKYLREKLGDDVRIVGVVPRGSPIVRGEGSMGEPIEGLSTFSVSDIFKRYRHLIDEVVEVSYEDAVKITLRVAREKGVLGGLSTGACIYAALREAKKLGGGNVVTLAPDSLFRYLDRIKV